MKKSKLMKNNLFWFSGILVCLLTTLLMGCNATATQIIYSGSTTTLTTTTTTTTVLTVITPNYKTNITTTPIAPQFFQAPMTIDKTFDGKEIHVNLVKFTGNVTSSNSIVTVNDIQAIVNSDGTYYAYLDLDPGKNLIQIKTNSNGAVTSEQIAVTFTPPLKVFINFPWTLPPNPNADYRKVPIEITGWVSDPAAKVKINRNASAVNSNGNFSAQIQLKQGNNVIEAVATLGDDSDTDSFGLPVGENGGLNGPPPYLLHDATSNIIFPGASTPSGPPFRYQVGVGQTAIEDIQLNIAKTEIGDNPPGDYFKPVITRTSGVGTGDTLPELPSLMVGFLPPTFKQYERIKYHTLLVIKASQDLVPGDYYFTVDYDLLGGSWSL